MVGSSGLIDLASEAVFRMRVVGLFGWLDLFLASH